MAVGISTASGSERGLAWSPLATARGTDPVSLLVHAIAICSKLWVEGRLFSVRRWSRRMACGI